MTLGQWVRNLSAGLLFGILAIGLLPFLLVYNCADLLGIIELESSPIALLLTKIIGIPQKVEHGDAEQQEANHVNNRDE